MIAELTGYLDQLDLAESDLTVITNSLVDIVSDISSLNHAVSENALTGLVNSSNTKIENQIHDTQSTQNLVEATLDYIVGT